LIAGGIALRQLATGYRGRISADRLAETARRAGIGSFVAVTCAAVALVYTAFTNDFSVSYILHHSNRALPGPYKFAALWSGQEGSLLLWACCLPPTDSCSACGIRSTLPHGLRLHHPGRHPDLLPAPAQLRRARRLRWCRVHNQRMASASIPYCSTGDGDPSPDALPGLRGLQRAICLRPRALMMRYPGEKWIHITRRWTMVTWLFLTCGIFLGAHWAYSVLGWGGYWGWDRSKTLRSCPGSRVPPFCTR